MILSHGHLVKLAVSAAAVVTPLLSYNVSFAEGTKDEDGSCYCICKNVSEDHESVELLGFDVDPVKGIRITGPFQKIGYSKEICEAFSEKSTDTWCMGINPKTGKIESGELSDCAFVLG